MNWHADDALIAAYASGAIDDARSFSLEAHLLACPTCRDACARYADRARVDAAWDEIVDRIDAPRAGVVERALTLVRVRPHVARLIAATPSLQLSWFAAVAVALAFAVLAAYGGRSGALVFLMLAPLVPLAGIAAAYGPGVDPTYEIGLAAPMRGSHLLLVRAVAVLSTSLVLGGIASLLLPRLDWTAAAWLLPALALSATSLAMATAVHPAWASSIIGACWVVGVGIAERLADPSFAAFRAGPQIAFAALALVAAAVVVRRRDRFEIASAG